MSVEFGIITSVVPPGGWHYQQILSSGQSVRIVGVGFAELQSNLREFRLRHSDLCGGTSKADIDEIRRDIKDYYCRNFRQNCAGASSVPHVQGGGIGLSYASPINRAADWLAKIGNERPEQVDAALAAQRAHTCAQCAQNVPWQTSCQPCNQNISIRSQNAKGSLATPYDRNLGVCRVYGHLNEVACWLKDSLSTPEHQVPAHCWKVQENQSGQ